MFSRDGSKRNFNELNRIYARNITSSNCSNPIGKGKSHRGSAGLCRRLINSRRSKVVSCVARYSVGFGAEDGMPHVEQKKCYILAICR